MATRSLGARGRLASSMQTPSSASSSISGAMGKTPRQGPAGRLLEKRRRQSRRGSSRRGNGSRRRSGAEGALRVVEQAVGSDDGGEDAAAVDVGDEEAGGVEAAGEAEIAEVAVSSGSSRRHCRRLRRRCTQSGARGGRRRRARGRGGSRNFRSIRRGQSLPDAAVEDHLAALVGGGLEQDRVHVGLGMEAARFGLRGLGAADLAAAGQAQELFDMFCALKARRAVRGGAARRRWRWPSSFCPRATRRRRRRWAWRSCDLWGGMASCRAVGNRPQLNKLPHIAGLSLSHFDSYQARDQRGPEFSRSVASKPRRCSINRLKSQSKSESRLI